MQRVRSSALERKKKNEGRNKNGPQAAKKGMPQNQTLGDFNFVPERFTLHPGTRMSSPEAAFCHFSFPENQEEKGP